MFLDWIAQLGLLNHDPGNNNSLLPPCTQKKEDHATIPKKRDVDRCLSTLQSIESSPAYLSPGIPRTNNK
jgi:hypothetical protein